MAICIEGLSAYTGEPWNIQQKPAVYKLHLWFAYSYNWDTGPVKIMFHTTTFEFMHTLMLIGGKWSNSQFWLPMHGSLTLQSLLLLLLLVLLLVYLLWRRWSGIMIPTWRQKQASSWSWLKDLILTILCIWVDEWCCRRHAFPGLKYGAAAFVVYVAYDQLTSSGKSAHH